MTVFSSHQFFVFASVEKEAAAAMRGRGLLVSVLTSLMLLSAAYPDDKLAELDDLMKVAEAPSSECQSCNPEECQKPVDCVAGLVKDSCGCCDVCGKAEYELCDHPKVFQRLF